MDEIVDPFEQAQKIAELTDQIELAALRNTKTREQAIAFGARLGADTAEQKGETGINREQRIARAKAYAAWEWDGKPEGGAHLVEFGVGAPKLKTHERWFRPDPKSEKRPK